MRARRERHDNRPTDNLLGVHDQAAERELYKACRLRDSSVTRIVMLTAIILAVATVSGIGFGALSVLGVGMPSWLQGGITGALTVIVVGAWARARVRKHLPAVAREQGRCESCGYLISEVTGRHCPECGKLLEPSPAKADDGSLGNSQ